MTPGGLGLSMLFSGLENVVFRMVWTFLSVLGRCSDCLSDLVLWKVGAGGFESVYFEALACCLVRSR